MKNTSKSIITGALAGFANGFFGAGGGMFLVPLFVRWLKLDEKKAFATSVAVIFPLSAVSLIIYYFKGDVDIGSVWPILLGGLAGGIIAGKVFCRVRVTFLRRIFGLLIIYGAIKAVFLL